MLSSLSKQLFEEKTKSHIPIFKTHIPIFKTLISLPSSDLQTGDACCVLEILVLTIFLKQTTKQSNLDETAGFGKGQTSF